MHSHCVSLRAHKWSPVLRVRSLMYVCNLYHSINSNNRQSRIGLRGTCNESIKQKEKLETNELTFGCLEVNELMKCSLESMRRYSSSLDTQLKLSMEWSSGNSVSIPSHCCKSLEVYVLWALKVVHCSTVKVRCAGMHAVIAAIAATQLAFQVRKWIAGLEVLAPGVGVTAPNGPH